MALAADVESARDRAAVALASAHDHFAYSQRLWRRLLTDSRLEPEAALILDNPITGSTVVRRDLPPVVTTALEQYLPSAATGELVAATEAFVSDVLRLWLVAHPYHFRDKVDVQTIVSAPDKQAILEAMADQYVGSLAYRAPREWFRQLDAIVHLGVPTDAQVDAFAELKATRDLFVHHRGIANETYVRKAGPLARAADGQPLDLPDGYVHDAYRLCHALVADVGTAAAARA